MASSQSAERLHLSPHSLMQSVLLSCKLAIMQASKQPPRPTGQQHILLAIGAVSMISVHHDSRSRQF